MLTSKTKILPVSRNRICMLSFSGNLYLCKYVKMEFNCSYLLLSFSRMGCSSSREEPPRQQPTKKKPTPAQDANPHPSIQQKPGQVKVKRFIENAKDITGSLSKMNVSRGSILEGIWSAFSTRAVHLMFSVSKMLYPRYWQW